MADTTSPSSKRSFPPILILAVGILAVSTASLLIRFAQVEAPSLVIAAGRMLVATVVIAPVAITWHRDELKSLSQKQWLLLVLGGVFLGFHFATWITSLEFTSVASSVVLVTTAPLWVAVFAPLFLKEKITRNLLVGLGIALLGSAIVTLSSNCSFEDRQVSCTAIAMAFQGRAFLGNGLALLGAFLSAGYLMVGRVSRGNLSLPAYAFVVYGVAAAVLALMVFLMRQPVTGFHPQVYLWLVALGLIPQLVGHSSFNWALKYLPATYVSIALLGEPIGTVILAYLFLAEAPSLLEVAGGGMILVGIVISSQARRVGTAGE
jgi:drug/metabolite transporter (DMT)-like permease